MRAGQRLRVDGDARGRPLGERARLAEHRDDPVAVALPWVGGVVGPLEGLERIGVAAGVLVAGRRLAAAREALVAAEPERLVVAESDPLDREAHEALGVGLLHVEREEDDVRTRDGTHLDLAVGLLAHPLPRW